MKQPIKILVLCTGNSCRSQMAEGYLRYFAGNRAEVFSAGLEAHGLNPRAVAAMQEDGIDISSHSSNTVQEYISSTFDWVITVCDHAQEHCPVFPAQTQTVHQSFPDPAKATGTEAEIRSAFLTVRDQIKAFCRLFAETHLSP